MVLVKDLDQETVARQFVSELRAGLDRIGPLPSADTIHSQTMWIVQLAQGHGMTPWVPMVPAGVPQMETAIDFVARLAWHHIRHHEPIDPNYVLLRVHHYAPQTAIDAALVGALARLRVAQNRAVPVAWLAVAGGLTYQAILQQHYRGTLEVREGMVPAGAARRWLAKR